MNETKALLGIETATRLAVVALADATGRLLAERAWQADSRPGASLHLQLSDLLSGTGTMLDRIGAVVAGIGPGSFTGSRVGLATAKTLAYTLRRPIVGVGTPEALASAAARARPSPGRTGREAFAVVLPAGASDHYLARVDVEDEWATLIGSVALLPPGRLTAEGVEGRRLVAVDLDGAGRSRDRDRLPAEASELGEAAVGRLGEALLALGARALEEGRVDDVRTLVPAYVGLPRGVTEAAAGTAWSPDLR